MYKVKIQCLPCDACNHTGWRTLFTTDMKDMGKKSAKWYRRQFKKDGLKVKLFKEKND